MKNTNDNDISDRQLRERIQDLEGYIDGRKAHWQALAERLKQERATAISNALKR